MNMYLLYAAMGYLSNAGNMADYFDVKY
ncbi:hypothetical protein SPIROBIBN47_60009 [uncultured spirochete]|uniref:Uncharacterized protein n=1 Tax=uncultured spirochete TaxID=156406 RepID=A0A3P3XMS0_9SPIR|nr:hypothetical protein SPIROBIBN47_60009 [uncultured spirochete]